MGDAQNRNEDIRETRPKTRGWMFAVSSLLAAAIIVTGGLYALDRFLFGGPAIDTRVLPAMVAGEWKPSLRSETQTQTLHLVAAGYVEYGDNLSDTWWLLHHPTMQVAHRTIDGAEQPVSVFTGELEIYSHDAMVELATLPVVIESRWTERGTIRRMTVDTSGMDPSTGLGPRFPKEWTTSN